MVEKVDEKTLVREEWIFIGTDYVTGGQLGQVWIPLIGEPPNLHDTVVFKQLVKSPLVGCVYAIDANRSTDTLRASSKIMRGEIVRIHEDQDTVVKWRVQEDARKMNRAAVRNADLFHKDLLAKQLKPFTDAMRHTNAETRRAIRLLVLEHLDKF